MLKGLSVLELGRLRVSVGYGTHKKGRPLSPVEVAELVDRARASGNTMAECAREIRIDESGLGRFLRLLELPEDLRHLVDWGSERGVLGYSRAVELVRIRNTDDMRAVANAVLERGLNSKETSQVAQLLERSGRPPDEVIREVLDMRPVIERRYVFIGAVIGESLSAALAKRTQREKGALLDRAMERLGLAGASGRLGTERFTLVGDEEFGLSISRVGKDQLEERLCLAIGKELDDAAASR